ncbi:MAG: hypothetical protein HPKKFMNG_03179 [Planctomycetes bacterium]|nr:hypothetical protein [Planctomycetota bacterium]
MKLGRGAAQHALFARQEGRVVDDVLVAAGIKQVEVSQVFGALVLEARLVRDQAVNVGVGLLTDRNAIADALDRGGLAQVGLQIALVGAFALQESRRVKGQTLGLGHHGAGRRDFLLCASGVGFLGQVKAGEGFHDGGIEGPEFLFDFGNFLFDVGQGRNFLVVAQFLGQRRVDGLEFGDQFVFPGHKTFATFHFEVGLLELVEDDRRLVLGRGDGACVLAVQQFEAARQQHTQLRALLGFLLLHDPVVVGHLKVAGLKNVAPGLPQVELIEEHVGQRGDHDGDGDGQRRQQRLLNNGISRVVGGLLLGEVRHFSVVSRGAVVVGLLGPAVPGHPLKSPETDGR